MSPATKKLYKKDVINRLGGALQYQKLIIEFTERLIGDTKLNPIYGCVSNDSVHKVQTELLELALADIDEESKEKLYTKVVVHHYRFFSLGLNATKFSIIKNHLLDALLHSWAESDVIDDILDLFEELRKDLFGTGDGFTNVVEEINGESRLQLLHVMARMSAQRLLNSPAR